MLTQSHFKGILEFYLTYSNLDAQEALIFWYRSFREGVAQGEVQRMGRFWTFKSGIFGRSFWEGKGRSFSVCYFSFFFVVVNKNIFRPISLSRVRSVDFVSLSGNFG